MQVLVGIDIRAGGLCRCALRLGAAGHVGQAGGHRGVLGSLRRAGALFAGRWDGHYIRLLSTVDSVKKQKLCFNKHPLHSFIQHTNIKSWIIV